MISARIVARPDLTDDELHALFSSSWDNHQRRPFRAELARSLTYLAAYQDTKLIGFVNVAWDGGSHAFLLDPTVLPACRRQGIGSALVRAAAQAAPLQGAGWLHVDYEPTLEPFHASVGFRPSRAASFSCEAGVRSRRRPQGRQARRVPQRCGSGDSDGFSGAGSPCLVSRFRV